MSSLLSAESFRTAAYASEARLRRWPWDQVWADLRLLDGTALPLDMAVSWLSAVCLVPRPDCNQSNVCCLMQLYAAGLAQDLSHLYLAHNKLESVFKVIVTIM